jgi:hypothetical protein
MIITLEVLISGLGLVGAAVLWRTRRFRPLGLLLGAAVAGFWCFVSTIVAALAAPGAMEPNLGSARMELGFGIAAVLCGLACLGALCAALYPSIGRIVRAVQSGHSQAGR